MDVIQEAREKLAKQGVRVETLYMRLLATKDPEKSTVLFRGKLGKKTLRFAAVLEGERLSELEAISTSERKRRGKKIKSQVPKRVEQRPVVLGEGGRPADEGGDGHPPNEP